MTVRSLARARGFTVVAVLSLALGIGANTTLFTIFHATWMKPVAGINGSDRMVELLLNDDGREIQEWPYPHLLDVREAQTPIAELAGWKSRDDSLMTADGTSRVTTMYVSANYFRVVGVAPSRGQGFLPAEDARPGQHPIAVVSRDLWQNRFGADPELVGETLELNRVLYTVVGVAPEGFRGHQSLGRRVPDLWVPQVPSRRDHRRPSIMSRQYDHGRDSDGRGKGV